MSVLHYNSVIGFEHMCNSLHLFILFLTYVLNLYMVALLLALIVNNKVAKSHIAVIGKNYYLSMQKDGDDIQLHELNSNNPLVDVKEKYPEITVNYSRRLRGIYETAKYMLYHNKN